MDCNFLRFTREMEWINVNDKPLPDEEWVLCYAKETEREYTEKGFVDVIEFNKEGPGIYVAKKTEYTIETFGNTCGCCTRQIVPVKWMPLPKPSKE